MQLGFAGKQSLMTSGGRATGTEDVRSRKMDGMISTQSWLHFKRETVSSMGAINMTTLRD